MTSRRLHLIPRDPDVPRVLLARCPPRQDVLAALELLDVVEARVVSLALLPRDTETLDAIGEMAVRLEDAFWKLTPPPAPPEPRWRRWLSNLAAGF